MKDILCQHLVTGHRPVWSEALRSKSLVPLSSQGLERPGRVCVFSLLQTCMSSLEKVACAVQSL